MLISFYLYVLPLDGEYTRLISPETCCAHFLNHQLPAPGVLVLGEKKRTVTKPFYRSEAIFS